jgi:catechol 2,3-dioxygenase-like lactoylglutathione lyase family enzyme
MKYLHTMIRISDVESSLDFYCNQLGLRCKTGPSNRIEEFDNVLDQRFGDNPIDINDDKYKEASEEAKKLLQFLNAFWNMQFVVAEVKG